MEDLHRQLAGNPQAATIGEANGRASIFLGSVSAGLVALGFAAQGGNSVGTMRAFALILFPVLVFVGLSTFFLPGPVLVPAVVGLAAMLGAAAGQHRYQMRRRQAAPAPFAPSADTADAAPPGPA